VNLAPTAFRAYAAFLLDRERLINPSRLRGLHHAAVHEAKTWNTSMLLVIERVVGLVEQMKTLAGLRADLDQKQWSPIYHTARHAIDQLRPFEQRDTPTTPDHHQIARYMEAARVTYELCEKAAQNPAQSVHAESRTDSHDESETAAPLTFVNNAAVAGSHAVPPRGVEPRFSD
jgi:hypothetical protein